MSRSVFSWKPLAIGAAVGAVCAIAFWFGVFGSWSARLTDRLFLTRPPSPLVTIVAIDDASIAQLGRWPWPRSVHAELIQKLSAAGVKVIAYDVNFPDASTPTDDASLARAIQQAGNVVLPVELHLEVKNGQLTFDPTQTVSSISSIASAAAAVGNVQTPPDGDGVVRQYPLSIVSPTGGAVPSFAAQALRLFGAQAQVDAAPLDTFGRIFINFLGAPNSSFQTISAAAVVNGTADLSGLSGHAVFVGATAPDLHDDMIVPTSDGVPMPGVEVHASVFDTVLQQKFLVPVPKLDMALLLILLGLLAGFAASALKTRWALITLGLVLLAVAIGGFVLFDAGHILDLIWPVLALIFAYGAATIERRLSADKERRELKQAFSRYVSKSVVESIMSDPSKLHLGGERRRMSVLFSDIRGFTNISEKLDPDALVKTLNTHLSRMTDIVFAHEGVLDKYIGDAVMAFWNAPFDQLDHAKRAVATGLEMQRALVEMNKAKVFGSTSVRVGVGINTGDMVVGNIGGEQRFDYTVIGDAVNLASRLEALTRQYEVGVIVTEATRADLDGAYLVRRLDKVAVKGKKEPVLIFEVMTEMTAATPAQKKLAGDYDAAFATYLSKSFATTVALCTAILITMPDDVATKLLLERAQGFLQTPPPADWDGTWVYTKK